MTDVHAHPKKIKVNEFRLGRAAHHQTHVRICAFSILAR
jgi:hypothetical protein